MPKKEEILEKNDKIKKEKISSQKTVKEVTPKAKVENQTKKANSSKNSTSKNATAKKTTSKNSETKKATEKTTKNVSTNKKQAEAKTTVKKEETKKLTTEKETKNTQKKSTSKKETTSATKKEIENKNQKVSTKNESKSDKTDKKEEKKKETKVDELSVIEKIKSFIAKIAAMQEEARKEAQAEKEADENKKEEKVSKVVKKLKTKEEKEVKKFEYLVEYYDLPYRYNETVVKILAQTPKRMFVYWDISDNDREKYIKTFGEDFFEKTYPVLLLYNEDKKYIKEIVINDFANSWYIDIPDPKTKYSIQLGRKFKTHDEVVKVNTQKVQENNIILHTDYLPLANSNVLEVPNDRILINSLPRLITFRNVKTNEERVVELKDIKNAFGNSYDVKEFYEEHYKDEVSEGLFDMANPSSRLSSSSFK